MKLLSQRTSVKPGGITEVSCETDSANPTPHIQWKVGSAVIEDNDLGFITTSLVKGDHNAMYRTSTLRYAATLEKNSIDCELETRSPLLKRRIKRGKV